MKAIPTVKEIVKAYLKEHGYDGLYGEYCGCEVDDLMVCDEACEDCVPGYKWTSCEGCPNKGECEFEGENDWCIRSDKPESEATDEH